MVWLPFSLAVYLGMGAHAPGWAPMTDILGVCAGDEFDEARERLERLAEPAKAEEEEEHEEEMAAFNLKGSPFRSVVMHGAKERVSWISAFVRDPAGIPFTELGDPTKGKVTSSLATWEVHRGTHVYRLLARGSNGRAQVVTLLAPTLSRRR